MDCNINEQIVQLRKEGLGVRQIAKKLNVTMDRVQYHSKKNGLGGFVAGENTRANALEIFKRNLEKNGHNFTYHSGFKNTESNVNVQCITCNKVISKSAQFAKGKQKTFCNYCVNVEKVAKENKRSINLNKNYFKKKNKEEPKKINIRFITLNKPTTKVVYVEECKECGCLIKNFGRRKTFCSDDCNRKYDNQKRERRRRKMKDNGTIDKSITLTRVFEHYKGECYLCGNQCDFNDKEVKNGNVVVGYNYPTLEHVIPISKGGTHTWDNVKLAHHYCNSLKSDNEIGSDTKQIELKL